MLRLLPVLLALLVATPSFAQDVITPGHPDMDTSLLDEGEMLFSISIKRGPMEQTIGSLTASLTIDEDAGQIKAIRAYEMMGQKLADTRWQPGRRWRRSHTSRIIRSGRCAFRLLMG